ncbi:MAG: ester cyclase [Paracoccaceae bacterium]
MSDSTQAEPAGARPSGPKSALRFERLDDAAMPTDHAISLSALRRGGTDSFLHGAPEHAVRQDMTGFQEGYVNIVDWIVRITHRIWEEKEIGYIYDTYAHDCRVWDDVGLQLGRDKIVADTVHTNAAFPDMRLIADEVIWAGDAARGFHTSHRLHIVGTNTGWSRFGSPTDRRIQLLCLANCVSRAGEIFDEWVCYDTVSMVRQMGLDVAAIARAAGADLPRAPFTASEPRLGQGKPARAEHPGALTGGDAIRALAEHWVGQIWNRRDLSALDAFYAPDVAYEGVSGRSYHGPGQIRAHMLTQLAMFPTLRLTVEDLYWMGNEADGWLVALRWGGTGAHRGNGPYGPPTGREVHLSGLTHWQIENGRVTREWTGFNEFGVLMQLLGATE